MPPACKNRRIALPPAMPYHTIPKPIEPFSQSVLPFLCIQSHHTIMLWLLGGMDFINANMVVGCQKLVIFCYFCSLVLLLGLRFLYLFKKQFSLVLWVVSVYIVWLLWGMRMCGVTTFHSWILIGSVIKFVFIGFICTMVIGEVFIVGMEQCNIPFNLFI